MEIFYRIVKDIIMYSVLILLLCVWAESGCDDGTYYTFDYDLYEDVLDPMECRKHLENMNSFEFYDASFRIPQGILRGGITSLGNYHQCLAIKQQQIEGSPIEGKYCMLNIPFNQFLQLPNLPQIPENTKWPWDKLRKLARMEIDETADREDDDPMLAFMSMDLAVCIPKSCTVQEALALYFNNDIVNMTYYEIFCRLPNDKPFVKADYIAIAAVSVVGLLTILSTGYDLHYRFVKRADPKEANVILRCCSVYHNTNRLLTFKSSPGAIECLDGIRAISILWVITGHCYVIYLSTHIHNGLDILEWLEDPRSSLWIRSATISVDTFFLLSGLLLVYTAANKLTPKGLLKNLHLFYLKRLLRMFPLLVTAVLLQASLFHHAADGVNWVLVANQVDSCREYWWSALLHIQNWVNQLDLCIPPSWYLSVDTQLHMLSPLVLFWVLQNRHCAWKALTVTILVSLIGTTIYCFTKNFQVSTRKYFMSYYGNTLVRSPPLIIGMMLGYLLFILREKYVRLPVSVVLSSYSAALILSFYCIYHSHAMQQPEWDSQLATNFTLSYTGSCWALSVGWLIFACVHGYAGPINWFLSWQLWKFISRISYAMYLFHYPLQYIFAGSMIHPFYFSNLSMFTRLASDLAVITAASAVACVIVDAPVSTLMEKYMYLRFDKIYPRT